MDRGISFQPRQRGRLRPCRRESSCRNFRIRTRPKVRDVMECARQPLAFAASNRVVVATSSTNTAVTIKSAVSREATTPRSGYAQ